MVGMPLEDHYFGDAAFHELAAALEAEWAACPNQIDLLSIVGGDHDLAVVLNYHSGGRYVDFFRLSVPGLGGPFAARMPNYRVGP
jgi:hypothetical protein